MSLTEFQRNVCRLLAAARIAQGERYVAGGAPDIDELGRTWRGMLQQANETMALLPEDHVGQCVMSRGGDLFGGSPDVLKDALADDAILFHEGTVRGAWPTLCVRPKSAGIGPGAKRG